MTSQTPTAAPAADQDATHSASIARLDELEAEAKTILLRYPGAAEALVDVLERLRVIHGAARSLGSALRSAGRSDAIPGILPGETPNGDRLWTFLDRLPRLLPDERGRWYEVGPPREAPIDHRAFIAQLTPAESRALGRKWEGLPPEVEPVASATTTAPQ